MAAGIAPSEEFHDDGWIWRAPALQFSKLNRNPEIWNLKTVLFAVLFKVALPSVVCTSSRIRNFKV